MKKSLFTPFLLTLLCMGVVRAAEPQQLTPQQLASRGLPDGAATEVLHQGAILHVQLNDLFSVLEGVEEIVVAAVPEKAAPPDVQDLLAMEHPVLAAVGMNSPAQQPITPELLSQMSGLDWQGAASLTLYPGDPRRLWVLSLPAGERQTLAGMLTGLLEPSEVEDVDLGNEKTALRIVPGKVREIRELYVVSSERMVFICGDRSLASALHNTPSAQRLARDPFLSRAIPADDDKQVRVVLNPALAKPLAGMLRQFWPMVEGMLHQKRVQMLRQLPQEAREQLDMQVRQELGVRDLEHFADYAECIVLATAEQLLDFITNKLIGFEGFTLTAKLQEGFPELNVKVFAHGYQEASCAAPLPMGEVREALAWLGPEFQCLEVTGRKPQVKDLPIFNAWVQRVKQQFAAKGLSSKGFDQLSQLLASRRAIQPVESRARWTLTTYAPLRPVPSLLQADSLEDYFTSLELPVYRPIKLIPGKGPDFLAEILRSETDALNDNRALTLDFVQQYQKGKPLIRDVSRFDVQELGSGVTRFVRENNWVTRGGIFGYDQHELVNRRVYSARRVGDYLVYHRGAFEPDWLREFSPARSGRVVGGVEKLLDRVPEGANYVAVHRVLVGLPGWVDWVSLLEQRIHADIESYLDQAQAIVDGEQDVEAAIEKVRLLRMPELVASVNLEPESKRVYVLLPGNIVFPRPRVLPVIQDLLKDYAAKANDVGGSLVYTRVQPESWEFTIVQSTEALTTLISSVGNTIAETYLASGERQRELRDTVWMQRDGDPGRFDEVLARNPQWAFIPMPPKKTPAVPTKPIPQRSAQAGAGMVDLSAHYNAALDQSWHSGNMDNNTLESLPQGIQEIGGVKFDVRGIIQLSGQGAMAESRVKFPEEVTNITVNRKGSKIHFLHAAGWPSDPNTRIGSFVVHFANGQSRNVPIVYGTDVRDWWEPAEIDGSDLKAVWSGDNTSTSDDRLVSLYRTSWVNPLSDVEISSIDYRSEMANSAPFLIAITVGE